MNFEGTGSPLASRALSNCALYLCLNPALIGLVRDNGLNLIGGVAIYEREADSLAAPSRRSHRRGQNRFTRIYAAPLISK